jgi:four helix bundle protein
MHVKSYKDLIVWQKSIELVKKIFILTEKFPRSELYGIISQMRRAAISIPSNIAEGYGRRSRKEYAHSCSIAYGSALELETQLIIAKDLRLSDEKNFKTSDLLLEEITKMLNVMITKLNNTP